MIFFEVASKVALKVSLPLRLSAQAGCPKHPLIVFVNAEAIPTGENVEPPLELSGIVKLYAGFKPLSKSPIITEPLSLPSVSTSSPLYTTAEFRDTDDLGGKIIGSRK